MSSKKALLAFAALNATAWDAVIKNEPLNEEQREIVSDLIREEQDTLASVQFMLDASNIRFDKKGKPVKSEKDPVLAQQLDETGERLQFYFDHDRIRVYDPDDIKKHSVERLYIEPGEEVAGFLRSGMTRGDMIRLNEQMTDKWTAGVLMHEALHKSTGFHEEDIKTESKQHGWESPEVAQAGLEHGDASTVVGHLYSVVSDAYTYEINRLEENLKSENPEYDIADSLEHWELKSADEWCETQVHYAFKDFGGVLGAYDITQEELKQAYIDGRLFEQIREARKEIVSEFDQEAGAERAREYTSSGKRTEGGRRKLR